MIGNFNLPIAKGNAKTYMYGVLDGTFAPGYGTTRGISHTTWVKPKGINFIYGLLIGPGSGGGGGYSFGAGTAGGGGGGGTGGAALQFLQPAYLVPDILNITVGRGGLGGAADTAGTLPNNQATALYYPQALQGLNFSGDSRGVYAAPVGYYGSQQSGRGGTVTAGGAGGTAAGSFTTTQMPGISGFSSFAFAGSTAGFNGGFGTAGVNATYSRLAGGAGGGSVSSSIAYPGGDAVTISTSVNSIWSRNLSGGANTGVAGENGITLFEPTFFSLPGAGGGANTSGTGGAGGKGGIGCGGGGGGAGITGGRGGDGGDGLAILVCW